MSTLSGYRERQSSSSSPLRMREVDRAAELRRRLAELSEDAQPHITKYQRETFRNAAKIFGVTSAVTKRALARDLMTELHYSGRENRTLIKQRHRFEESERTKDESRRKFAASVPTLKNLDRVHKEFIKKHQTEDEGALRQAKEMLSRIPIASPLKLTLEAANAMCGEYLRHVLAKADFSTRVPGFKILNQIFIGGFKTQIQLEAEGTEGRISRGAPNTGGRKYLSRAMFGTESSDNPYIYEYYGYAASQNPEVEYMNAAVRGYGGIQIVFNKQRLADRTTFALGDTLNHYMRADTYTIANDESNDTSIIGKEPGEPSRGEIHMAAVRVTEPGLHAISARECVRIGTEEAQSMKARLIYQAVRFGMAALNPESREHIGDVTTDPVRLPMELAGITRRPQPSVFNPMEYIELQFHGGLDFEDVESVVIMDWMLREGDGDTAESLREKTEDIRGGFPAAIASLSGMRIPIKVLFPGETHCEVINLEEYLRSHETLVSL